MKTMFASASVARLLIASLLVGATVSLSSCGQDKLITPQATVKSTDKSAKPVDGTDAAAEKNRAARICVY